MTEIKSNIEIGEDNVLLFVNPKIYPLEAIYSAAYVFLDKAYILLDGDPKSEVIVELKPKKKIKKKEVLEKLGREFTNELINYSDYQKRAEKTHKIRELILQRALFTNTLPAGEKDYEFDKIIQDMESEEDIDYIEDPEAIAVPWEEKYGKSASEEDLKQAKGRIKNKS